MFNYVKKISILSLCSVATPLIIIFKFLLAINERKVFDRLSARALERNFTRRKIVCAVHKLDFNFRLFDDR